MISEIYMALRRVPRVLDAEPFRALMNGLGPVHAFSIKQACKIDNVRLLTHICLSAFFISLLVSNLLGYWDHFSTWVLKQYLPDRTCLINTECTKFNKQREPLIRVSNTKWPWLFCFKIFSSSVKKHPCESFMTSFIFLFLFSFKLPCQIYLLLH